jgi:hypothetical protein
METEGDKVIDRARAEELLAAATELQAAFWDALTDWRARCKGSRSTAIAI